MSESADETTIEIAILVEHWTLSPGERKYSVILLQVKLATKHRYK